MFTPQMYILWGVLIQPLIHLHQHTHPLFSLQFHKQRKILCHNKEM